MDVQFFREEYKVTRVVGRLSRAFLNQFPSKDQGLAQKLAEKLSNLIPASQKPHWREIQIIVDHMDLVVLMASFTECRFIIKQSYKMLLKQV